MTMGRVQIRVWERLDKFLEQYHIIYHTTSYHTIIRSYHNKLLFMAENICFFCRLQLDICCFTPHLISNPQST